MFIQGKQAEWFEDKKKSVNGRKVVVQVDFIENYISVTGTSDQLQVTLFSVCA